MVTMRGPPVRLCDCATVRLCESTPTPTSRFPAGFTGLAVGITLAIIHLATIPVDNTSVNPARSIGAAVFSGGDAMSQLWAFVLWPMVGGVVGVIL